MDTPFFMGRKALDDASTLMQDFGHHAEDEAASRAERSRSDLNLSRYCHWRQVERLLAAITSDEVRGTIH